MAPFTLAEFYNLTGLTSDTINENYVVHLISSITSMIEDEIGEIFTPVTVDDTYGDKYDFYGNGTGLVKIGPWNENGLEVYIGALDQVADTPLVLNVDYRIRRRSDYIRQSTKADPVVAIEFLSSIFDNYYYNNYRYSNNFDRYESPKLMDNMFVRIRGDYGWVVPGSTGSAYESDIYNIILHAVHKSALNMQATNAGGGNGLLEAERSLTLERKYKISDEMFNSFLMLGVDPVHSKLLSKVIRKYKNILQTNVRIS